MKISKIILLSGFAILSACNQQSKEDKAEEKEALNEVETALRELGETNKKDFQSGDFEGGSEQLDEIISATTKLKDGKSDEAIIYKIIGNNMKVMQTKMSRMEKEQEGLDDIVDYSTLHEANDIDERIKFLDNVIKANEVFKAYVTKEYYDTILAEVDAADVPNTVKSEFKVGFQGGGKTKQNIEQVGIIRDSEIEILEIFKKQIQLLGSDMDKWEWNADTDAVEISDTAMAEEYNSSIEAIQKAAFKQVEAQKRIGELQ